MPGSSEKKAEASGGGETSVAKSSGKTEQLSLDVGPELVPVSPKRGKHYIEPKGYACSPGTGPSGETCGTCKHYLRMGRSKHRFAKCGRNRHGWTHSRRTDILAGARACKYWEKKDDNRAG